MFFCFQSKANPPLAIVSYLAYRHNSGISIDSGINLLSVSAWTQIKCIRPKCDQWVAKLRHWFFNLSPWCFSVDCINSDGLTLDLKRRLMTPFDRLSAVRSQVPWTDMLLLSLLALGESTSSVPPTTAKDRPADRNNFSACASLITSSQWNLCLFLLIFWD